ncbi:methyltransferase domain-containing protein, partial [Mycobacterium sp. KBS0706]|uniref:class I SAM-dependent methyltransferase n=1 Tax=Mycobacterium sp. KBS0706 TaxID=2578109 RepID=UPI00117DF30C
IFNADFKPELALAGVYESSQAASPTFSAFSRALATDWVTRYGLAGKRIIEVGCGHADFMVDLLRAGVADTIGIDPLTKPEEIPPEFKDRITIDRAEFAPEHTLLPAAALVCRHTLEHIPDVAGFLGLVADWARRNPASPILIEVPGTERILAEGAFWDIFYEHCNYFTLNTLSEAFVRAGLAVESCELVYSGQYLLLVARAPEQARELGLAITRAEHEAAVAEAIRFGGTIRNSVARCRAAIEAMDREEGPVVVWQGAAKCIGFHTALGRDIPIACAVDLNVARHGKFLPPFGLAVRAPAELAQLRPSDVVLLNPMYANEVRADLDRFGLMQTRLHSVNELCVRSR